MILIWKTQMVSGTQNTKIKKKKARNMYISIFRVQVRGKQRSFLFCFRTPQGESNAVKVGV